jgi:hypothetical protein
MNMFQDLTGVSSVSAFKEKLKWVQQHWQTPSSSISGANVQEQRKNLILELANSSLRANGVPSLQGFYPVSGMTGTAYNFSFSPLPNIEAPKAWTLGIDERLLNLSFADVTSLASYGKGFSRISGLVYHEARHVQQYYWVAVHRSRMVNQLSNSALASETLVPLSIIDETKKDIRQFTAKQTVLVKKIFDLNISPYPDTKGIIPRSQTSKDRKEVKTYLGIFQERDAYYAHKLAYPELVVGGLILPPRSDYD